MSKYHQLCCLSTAAWGRGDGYVAAQATPKCHVSVLWQNGRTPPRQKLIKVKEMVNNAEIAWFFGDSY